MSKTEERISYRSIVDYVAEQTHLSYRRTKHILTELPEAIKAFVAEGHNVELEGLCLIYLTTKPHDIYENTQKGSSDLVQAIHTKTQYSELDIQAVILNYYKRIRTLLELGHRVNVKSVGYFSGNTGTITARVSGVLKRPASASFCMVNDRGQLYVGEVTERNILLRIEMSKTLAPPVNRAVAQPLAMRVLDI